MLTDEGFDRFRLEYNEALKDLAERFQVNIKMEKIIYDTIEFHFRTIVTPKSIGGKSYDQVNFEKNCWMYNLEKTDFGKPFNHQIGSFRICGIDSKKSKYPILAKNIQTGKIARFQSTFVAREIKNIEEL